MFSRCAFCNAAFDGDGGPSGLGVGRRIAFDEWRGRLWVVCPRCSRWNLTPFDDRLERIEAVARAASNGRIAASMRSEEHTSELQSQSNLVCRLLLEKKKKYIKTSARYWCSSRASASS